MVPTRVLEHQKNKINKSSVNNVQKHHDSPRLQQKRVKAEGPTVHRLPLKIEGFLKYIFIKYNIFTIFVSLRHNCEGD